MNKNNPDLPDCNYRSWCLEHAIHANKKNTPPEKIIKDAEIYYGFLFPQNGHVKHIPNTGTTYDIEED